MKVLVTGGAGYIGSHAVRALIRAGHDVVVLDNLSHGFAEAVQAAAPQASFVRGDVADPAALAAAYTKVPFEAVLHFAAFIEVGESVEDPAKYYRNNFVQTFAMLEWLRNRGICKVVFSSTAAVYGNPEAIPIPEDARPAPINPYGHSKRMVELALHDFAAAYDLGFTILRYFNVAGASSDAAIGEAHEPESHLIPRLLQAAQAGGASASIFGTDYPTPDGTCVRDYVHVEDLAEAHVLALECLAPGQRNLYNLGSERGFSVREVLRACEAAIGRPIACEEKPRRAGDPAVLVASSEKIRRELGWQPRYPELATIVGHAWAWHCRRPRGYRDAAESVSS